MIERRHWQTRPWRNRGQAIAPRMAAPIQHSAGSRLQALPYLWFLAGPDGGTALQSWTTDPQTVFIPCFRSEEEAETMAHRAGVEPAQVLGFAITELPDLLADLSHRVLLVTDVGDNGQVYGHYFPAPAEVGTRGATRAA